MFNKKDKKINMNQKKDFFLIVPGSDWKALLLVSSVLLLASLVFGIYIFWKTEKESLFYSEYELGESKVDTINTGYLGSSLKRFENRVETIIFFSLLKFIKLICLDVFLFRYNVTI